MRSVVFGMLLCIDMLHVDWQRYGKVELADSL